MKSAETETDPVLAAKNGHLAGLKEAELLYSQRSPLGFARALPDRVEAAERDIQAYLRSRGG